MRDFGRCHISPENLGERKRALEGAGKWQLASVQQNRKFLIAVAVSVVLHLCETFSL